MYNCDCCTTPSKPLQKVVKITIFKVVNERRQIERELKVCPLCAEGYHQGIPLKALAVMHRPVSPPPTPVLAPGGSAAPTTSRANAPLAGASLSVGLRAFMTSSPKDKPPTPGLDAAFDRLVKADKPSKADKLLAQQEERGSRRKPTKRIVHADHKANKASPKGKQQTGGAVP